MDITLYDESGTYKITDTTGLSVTITLPIPNLTSQYGASNIAASAAGGELERLGGRVTVVEGVPVVTFTATHFSPYTIYVDLDHLLSDNADNTPKTGDAIHPKWYLVVGLASLSLVLFFRKEKLVLA
jgi:LPXTG-motif cell wall-anchored protein